MLATKLQVSNGEESLLNKAYSTSGMRIIIQWANGAYGSMVDYYGDDTLRFVETKLDADTDVDKGESNTNQSVEHPIVATGIIVHWLKSMHAQRGTKEVFEEYYNQCLNRYIRKEKTSLDACERNLPEEFGKGKHLREELKRIEQSKAIYPYLPEADVKQIEELTKHYSRFVRNKNMNDMPANRLIDNIVPSECNNNLIVFNNSYWSNGKMGSITDAKGDCVFRFYEMKAGKFAAEVISEKPEDNPIVATGIVAYCLHNRINDNKLFERLRLSKFNAKSIIDQFIGYTEEQFNNYKKRREQEPDSWRCNIEEEFYTKIAIPQAVQQNKESEALFEYIAQDDCVFVKGIMREYIMYLEEQKKKYIKNELPSENSLDQVFDMKVNAAVEKYIEENTLTNEGIDKIIEEADKEDSICIANKSITDSVKDKPTKQTPPKKNKTQKPKDYSRRSFNLKVPTRLMEYLYELLRMRDEDGKRFIDGDMQAHNDVKTTCDLTDEDLQYLKPVDIDKMMFNQVFSGKDTDVIIVWEGDANELLYLIHMLYKHKTKDGNILDWQHPGPRIWELTRFRFKNGKTRKVLDERTGKMTDVKTPIEFEKNAFAHQNYPQNTTRLDNILNKIIPQKEKSISEEIEIENQENTDYEKNVFS